MEYVSITIDIETYNILKDLSQKYRLPMYRILRIILGLDKELEPLREQILKEIQSYTKQ